MNLCGRHMWNIPYRDAGMFSFKRHKLTKVLSVTEGHPARAINSNNVLVELLHLQYHSGAFPTLRVVTDQILNIDMIPNLKGLKKLGMFRPFLMLPRVALGQGPLSVS